MSKQTCNPLTKYYHDKFPKQKQAAPGLQCEMDPVPDCGEKSYQGHQRLEGKKMLVTGGDSGIGRAAAIAYAKEGADVAINYHPDEQKDAEDVAKIIEKAGRKAVLIPGDLSDEAFCKKMVDEAHNKLGGLDNLTLVAGKQTSVADIMDLTTEQIRKTFEINVFSLFWTTKAALGYLKPGSTIITTSSVQAFQPGASLLDYAATKSAIIAFTKGLAKQIASKGIRANIVAPGPVWTPLQICGGQPSDAIPEFGKETPLKRAGQPVELAGVYVHLASSESSYTTAETYGVTGGEHTN
ncbi:NAD(P)-dependent oxidoreductase [Gilliamella sp. Choc4-2]|jgi:NAD(P)-dependent dehydrogenase (short-subunit alcohol dehydrogenase family)|uniref:SDR family oxidoreductase n=1 Tax=unclassified Gilliamella TaxID=2685620 RepID=UPI00080EDCAC|nr:SDR family oxidoreductase [Gilliamella apicola]OCG33146.1 NAD(P)-dependent oxidoreductase [Gilliamella apicola]OCG46102.1 NAD(P)-dependent oxidoreductase [Gilliamella apicola]OCG54874.1 NAD(P)-dependent oxidoreductase [Gilliamella apicola]